MTDLPAYQALLLCGVIAAVVVAVRTPKMHPFVALTFASAAFGLAAGLSISLTSKAFGNGFAPGAYAPGLLIVAAALISAIADEAGAGATLKAFFARRRPHATSGALAGLVG